MHCWIGLLQLTQFRILNTFRNTKQLLRNTIRSSHHILRRLLYVRSCCRQILRDRSLRHTTLRRIATGRSSATLRRSTAGRSSTTLSWIACLAFGDLLSKSLLFHFFLHPRLRFGLEACLFRNLLLFLAPVVTHVAQHRRTRQLLRHHHLRSHHLLFEVVRNRDPLEGRLDGFPRADTTDFRSQPTQKLVGVINQRMVRSLKQPQSHRSSLELETTVVQFHRSTAVIQKAFIALSDKICRSQLLGVGTEHLEINREWENLNRGWVSAPASNHLQSLVTEVTPVIHHQRIACAT